MLAEDLDTWPEEAWLAVDDYQQLSGNEPGQSFLATLVAHSGARVLITSRVNPSWATARSRLYGHYFELGAADLAMTAGEESLILRDPLARGLTKGWPALVALAAAASSLPASRERLDDSAELHSFLAEELFRSIPQGVQ